MPLGFVISVDGDHYSDIANTLRESEDAQIFKELFQVYKGEVDGLRALDCGRGYMHLVSYLLEHSEAGDVLLGDDHIISYEDGTSITGTPSEAVAKAYGVLSSIDNTMLDELAARYKMQIAAKSAEPHNRQSGFLSRLFGRAKPKNNIGQAEQNIHKAESGLMDIFDSLKQLYSDAAKSERGVITAIYL